MRHILQIQHICIRTYLRNAVGTVIVVPHTLCYLDEICMRHSIKLMRNGDDSLDNMINIASLIFQPTPILSINVVRMTSHTTTDSD